MSQYPATAPDYKLLWDQASVISDRIGKTKNTFKILENAAIDMEKSATEAGKSLATLPKKISKLEKTADSYSAKTLIDVSVSEATQMSQSFSDFSNSMKTSFKDSTITARDRVLNHYKKVSTRAAKLQDTLDKAKANYVNSQIKSQRAVDEADAILTKLNDIKNRNAPPKEVTALEKKYSAALKNAAVADVSYQKATEVCRQAQNDYKTGMVEIMNEYLLLDRDRLASIKNAMMSYSNILYTFGASIHTGATKWGQSAASMDINMDMLQVTHSHYTSKEKPALPEYEKCVSGLNVTAEPPTKFYTLVADFSSTEAGYLTVSAGDKVTMINQDIDGTGWSTVSLPDGRQGLVPQSYLSANGEAAVIYTNSSVNRTSVSVSTVHEDLREALVIEDFEADPNDPNQISIQANSRVVIIQVDEGWALVLRGDGVRGYVPASYLE